MRHGFGNWCSKPAHNERGAGTLGGMTTYDHIVIGAGSAGCVVAARLSEDPHRSVLLIEAGGSNRRLDVRAPAAFSKQFHSKVDWDYFCEPEAVSTGAVSTSRARRCWAAARR